MSLDKLVDSTQLDTDLSSVADAIRAKSGGSASLAFPAGFVSEIDGIGYFRAETLRYTPSSDVYYFDISNPVPGRMPKYVTAELDEESYTGELKSMNVYSCFWTDQFQNYYSGFTRFHAFINYRNSSGSSANRAMGTTSAYSAGITEDLDTVRIPGYSAADNKYKAGATYIVTLYYWD